ncbi:uncharacterized protein CLUP02_06032 [Colletotrichum lupini]|uniref:Uncharacterized protein n=1 Tax=Colletotrichum lupini TaxID=145971 RepID=A0A9Q8SNB9_9PEZI|nr:uncharacterized protein CLUP02_06032 [Colletotrichum lupini]UQC80549.1 hypothetical protein CLUP02_06032 [Colletotrichum lupini]
MSPLHCHRDDKALSPSHRRYSRMFASPLGRLFYQSLAALHPSAPRQACQSSSAVHAVVDHLAFSASASSKTTHDAVARTLTPFRAGGSPGNSGRGLVFQFYSALIVLSRGRSSDAPSLSTSFYRSTANKSPPSKVRHVIISNVWGKKEPSIKGVAGRQQTAHLQRYNSTAVTKEPRIARLPLRFGSTGRVLKAPIQSNHQHDCSYHSRVHTYYELLPAPLEHHTHESGRHLTRANVDCHHWWRSTCGKPTLLIAVSSHFGGHPWPCTNASMLRLVSVVVELHLTPSSISGRRFKLDPQSYSFGRDGAAPLRPGLVDCTNASRPNHISNGLRPKRPIIRRPSSTLPGKHSGTYYTLPSENIRWPWSMARMYVQSNGQHSSHEIDPQKLRKNRTEREERVPQHVIIGDELRIHWLGSDDIHPFKIEPLPDANATSTFFKETSLYSCDPFLTTFTVIADRCAFVNRLRPKASLIIVTLQSGPGSIAFLPTP